jgi:diacylglycerol O-acyltransferase / wax synthase
MQAERMNRVDAAWLHMDRPGNTADIVGCIGFRSAPSNADVQRIVQAMLRRHPRFRERIHEAPPPQGPSWERDARFRIANHVSELALPPDDAALQSFVGEVATSPLDASRSPWRMHVVSRGEAGCSLVVKLHHCLADGFALVTLLLSLAGERTTRKGKAHRVQAERPLLERPVAAVVEALRNPLRFRSLAAEAAALARSAAHMALLPADPVTRLQRTPVGRRRAAWTPGVPLVAIRAAARAAGATVNDVLLAALAGALRGHLSAGGAPVDALPLRALVPVNLRALNSDGTAQGGMGNLFGLVFMDLPVHRPDPRARLEQVKHSSAAVKRSPDAAVALAILGGLGFTPTAVERLGTDFFARKASLVVTNVPGPRTALSLAGNRVDDLMFWVPHPATLGVGVSVLSYAGVVKIGVRADVAAMDDPSDLTARLMEELALLGCAPSSGPPARAVLV